jgi:hypothetical protein
MDGQDVALGGPPQVAGGGLDASEGRRDLLGVAPPRVRQDHRPVHAVEQPDPELLLQQLDLMADRRGGDEEFFCCKRERREPRSSFKGLHCLEGDPILHCNNHMN